MVVSPEICGFVELFGDAYISYGDTTIKIQAILHFIPIVVNSEHNNNSERKL